MAAAAVDQPHQRQAPERAQLQAAEHLDQPAYSKSKVSRPMVQREAGSGLYFRVNIVDESPEQVHVCFPAYDSQELPAYEWVWRTSDRIHRATNGKWAYVGRGAWKYNSRARKKRGRKGCKEDPGCPHAEARGRSAEPSASDCSNATNGGSVTGSFGGNAVALWFESHIRSRRAHMPDADLAVTWGPALSTSVRSQLEASLDIQTNPSMSGGTGATSARQPDSQDRCPLAGDSATPHAQPEASPEHTESRPFPSPPTSAPDPLAPADKATSALQASPASNESRRSSSTLEGDTRLAES